MSMNVDVYSINNIMPRKFIDVHKFLQNALRAHNDQSEPLFSSKQKDLEQNTVFPS